MTEETSFQRHKNFVLSSIKAAFPVEVPQQIKSVGSSDEGLAIANAYSGVAWPDVSWDFARQADGGDGSTFAFLDSASVGYLLPAFLCNMVNEPEEADRYSEVLFHYLYPVEIKNDSSSLKYSREDIYRLGAVELRVGILSSAKEIAILRFFEFICKWNESTVEYPAELPDPIEYRILAFWRGRCDKLQPFAEES
jgi:hypothetical protein